MKQIEVSMIIKIMRISSQPFVNLVLELIPERRITPGREEKQARKERK